MLPMNHLFTRPVISELCSYFGRIPRRSGSVLAIVAAAGLACPCVAQPATKPGEEGEMKRPGQAQPEQQPTLVPATPAGSDPKPTEAPPIPNFTNPMRKVVEATKTPEATPESLRRMAADALERVALFNVRAVEIPTANDYAATGILLGLAAEYAPGDLNLVRRQGEAAWGAGDTDLLMEMTRRAVQLDPLNTVAQLRLIASRLSQFQTAEERLSRMEALLGPKGSSLDAAVRSRIALDAALLYREKGDEARYVEKLKQSTQLDSTNKEAALQSLSYYTSKSNDPMGTLEVLTNLLYADPIDPNVHLQISGVLATMGAFDEARRFHRVYQEILKQDGTALNYNLTVERLVLDWRCDGVKSASDWVRADLYAKRNIVAREMREKLADDSTALSGNLSNLQRPEHVHLEPRLEYIRLVTAALLDDQPELKQSIADLAGSFEDQCTNLAAPNARDPGMTDAQAADQIRYLQQELCLWRLMVNADVDKVQGDLEKALKDVKDDNGRKVAITAWLALRTGDAAGALAACDLPNDDPGAPWIVICRAEALAATGKTAQAVAILDEVGGAFPLTTMATYAMERSALIAGAPRKPGNLKTPMAQRAAVYARKIPGWIDSMITEPKFFQSVIVETPPGRIGALERSTLTLRIRNISPIPLAMGSDKPLNTRFLFNPMLELADSPRPVRGEPEVFELDQRLRLNPNEEMVVVLRPEAGLIGYLAENGAGGPSRLRYRILQGFRQNEHGAGCVEVSTPTTAREPLLEARITPEQLIEGIETAGEATIPTVLIAARSMLLSKAESSDTFASNAMVDMARLIATKYPTWSVASRVLCASMMPPSGQLDVLKDLDAAIKADQNVQVKTIAVLTRITEATDPLLAAAAADADPTLKRAAAIQTERIAAGKPMYAKIGTSQWIKPADPKAAPASTR